MIKKLRVICSFGQEVFGHLALEKTLEKTVLPGEVILFFWINRPCVVIGKHQNPWRECNFSAMEERDVVLARRDTGGGAVYQDEGNLNISLISREPESEGLLAETMQKGLWNCGISVKSSGRNDLVLCDGRKVSGMAFSERNGVFLEHACMLVHTNLENLEICLTPSEKKTASKGVDSVRQRVANLRDISPEIQMAFLCDAIETCLGDLLQVKPEGMEEMPFVEEELLLKYGSSEWNLGKRSKYDLQLEDRFSWGEVQIQLLLQRGKIVSCEITSDALDLDWPTILEEKLVGSTLNPEDMELCLRKTPGLTEIMRRDLLGLFLA